MCFKLFKKPTETNPMPSLTYWGDITITELREAILNRFPGVQGYLSDRVYKTCTKNDVERFLAWDKTDKLQWLSELFDCDNFSFRLKGNIDVLPWAAIPFGIVWTQDHALNCFVDKDKKFWFVEPQNDWITETIDNELIRFIVI